MNKLLLLLMLMPNIGFGGNKYIEIDIKQAITAMEPIKIMRANAEAIDKGIKFIRINIDTIGGNFYGAIGFIQEMEEGRKSGLWYFCSGGERVLSAGAMIFSACDSRTSRYDTKFLFHYPYFETVRDATVEKMRTCIESLLQDRKDIYQSLKKHINVSESVFEAFNLEDVYSTPARLNKIFGPKFVRCVSDNKEIKC